MEKCLLHAVDHLSAIHKLNLKLEGEELTPQCCTLTFTQVL